MATYGDTIIGQLKAAGQLPPQCHRIVIDIQVGEVARVYFSCWGDEQFVNVNLLAGLDVRFEKAEAAEESIPGPEPMPERPPR